MIPEERILERTAQISIANEALRGETREGGDTGYGERQSNRSL
jgi:hypothetical protein